MNGRRLLGILSAFWISSSVSLADDGLAELEKKLDQSYADLKSYSAKSSSTSDISYGSTNRKMESSGTMEWVRRGDRVLMRSDTTIKTTTTENGAETASTSKITAVNDGEFSWVLNEEGGKKTVTKMRTPDVEAYSPARMFDAYREYYEIKLLADEDFDGQACYVVEMKMKPMQGAPPSGRQLMYFRKDVGLFVKSVSYDQNGKETSVNETTDIKLDAGISAERFKFQVPEGAEVTEVPDSSQSAAQSAQQTEEPAAQEQQSEPQAKPEQPKKKKKKSILPKPKLPKFP